MVQLTRSQHLLREWIGTDQGGKSLPATMLTQFTEAYMRYSGRWVNRLTTSSPLTFVVTRQKSTYHCTITSCNMTCMVFIALVTPVIFSCWPYLLLMYDHKTRSGPCTRILTFYWYVGVSRYAIMLCYYIETLPSLLALCVDNPPVTRGFPSQRANNAESWFYYVRRSKLLNKHSNSRRSETPCHSCDYISDLYKMR